MNEKHLATISIMVKDRKAHSLEVNKILTENGHLVLSRMGVNVQRHCAENCVALITVVIEATLKESRDLTKKLDGLHGIVAKENVMTE